MLGGSGVPCFHTLKKCKKGEASNVLKKIKIVVFMVRAIDVVLIIQSSLFHSIQ